MDSDSGCLNASPIAPPANAVAVATAAPMTAVATPPAEAMPPAGAANASADQLKPPKPSGPLAWARRRYARLSPALVASAFSSGKRRQRSEAEAEQWAARKLQTAWRGTQGRRAANEERDAKMRMWDEADNESEPSERGGGGFPSLFTSLSTPQKLPIQPVQPLVTEREDRTPAPSARPGRQVSDRASQRASDDALTA